MVEYTIFANNNLLYSSIEPDRGALISPQLKLEVNKSGSLTFTMLPNHEYYNSIKRMTTVITVYEESSIIFFGRVVDATIDFYKQKKVTCEGSLSFLLDTVITPFKYDEKNKKSIDYIFSKIVNEHNACLGSYDSWKEFNKGTVTVSKTDYWEYKSYGDTLSTLMSELVDVYGGILRTRHVAGTYGDYQTVTNYLDYIQDPSQAPGNYPLNDQTVEFGVNLLDFEAQYPVNDIFTVLMPVGNDKLTLPEKYLVNGEAVEKFGRIIKVQQWSSIKKASKLREKGQKYLNDHTKVYSDNLKVKALDLHYLSDGNQELKLLDRVKVYSEPHGFGTGSDLILFCLSAEYDLQNPENNSYLLGSHICEYKDKSELSKKSSSHKSSGRRSGGTTGTPTLSEMQTGTTQDVQETIDEVVNDKTDLVQSIMDLTGLKLEDVLKVKIPDALNGFSDKMKWLFDKFGLGNNDNPDDAASGESLNPFSQLKDMIESGISSFKEETDENKRLIGSTGIKTLSDITDDIVDINGREIHIGNVDGTPTSKISIRARDIDITGGLKTFIYGYEIHIGDESTHLIQLEGKEIQLTGLINDLMVKNLTTEILNTDWLFAHKRISAQDFAATDTVYATQFLRYDPNPQVPSEKITVPLVTIGDVAAHYRNERFVAKGFDEVEFKNGTTIIHPVATRDWVGDQHYAKFQKPSGNTFKPHINFIVSTGINEDTSSNIRIPSLKWVEDQAYAKFQKPSGNTFKPHIDFIVSTGINEDTSGDVYIPSLKWIQDQAYAEFVVHSKNNDFSCTNFELDLSDSDSTDYAHSRYHVPTTSKVSYMISNSLSNYTTELWVKDYIMSENPRKYTCVVEILSNNKKYYYDSGEMFVYKREFTANDGKTYTVYCAN